MLSFHPFLTLFKKGVFMSAGPINFESLDASIPAMAAATRKYKETKSTYKEQVAAAERFFQEHQPNPEVFFVRTTEDEKRLGERVSKSLCDKIDARKEHKRCRKVFKRELEAACGVEEGTFSHGGHKKGHDATLKRTMKIMYSLARDIDVAMREHRDTSDAKKRFTIYVEEHKGEFVTGLAARHLSRE